MRWTIFSVLIHSISTIICASNAYKSIRYSLAGWAIFWAILGGVCVSQIVANVLGW